MTRATSTASGCLWAVTAGAVAAVAAALVSQHVYDMQPCPWCVLQRAMFLLIAVLAGVAALWNSRPARLVLSGAVDALCTAGVAAALWQHLVAASSSSCNLTLADRIVTGLGLDALAPEAFAPRASCADAAVNLLGVPYAYWSLAAFVLLGTAAAWAMVATLRQP